jgi:hypothetical protein
LLTARKRRAGIVAALLEDGEEVIDRFQVQWPPTLRPYVPISRFSSTLSEGNSRRPSGTIATPRGHDRIRGALPMGLPSSEIMHRDHSQHTGDGPHERRLARAVGADDGDGLAFVQGDIDAEQRLEIAVVGGEIVCCQKPSYLDPQIDFLDFFGLHDHVGLADADHLAEIEHQTAVDHASSAHAAHARSR